MRRWATVCAGLLVAVPVGAAQRPGVDTARPAAAGVPSDIVVVGTRNRPSGWREAETGHVVILSDGAEAELVRLARNVERLHFLLSALTGRADAPDDTVKLRITMIGDVPTFQALDLRNLRWQQGPFNDLFTLSRFYDPRSDGAVMATTRVDQQIAIERTTATAAQVLSTLQAQGLNAGGGAPSPGSAAGGNPADAAALQGALIGSFATAGMRGPRDLTVGTGERTIPVSAESLLYAGYAQHYLLTYFPAAYPRWYLDGFAQIFASLVVRGDTVLEFGRSPKGTSAVLNAFGAFPLADVLSDKYLTENPRKTGWTPIHAWLLTHFLFFSDTRRPQLRRYLALRASGADAATAAAAFGDQRQLARELRAYFGARKPYEQVTYPAARNEEPAVRRLTEGQAAFVRGRLELGARVTIPAAAPAGAAPDVARRYATARADALASRDRWLERLHRDADRFSADLDAQLLLAEAECRSDHAAACLAAAARATALAPDDDRAQTWRGLAMALAAIDGPAATRAADLAAARRVIVAANRRDPSAVEPLLAYHRSFAVAGEPGPVAAIDGLQQAMEGVPAAPETRLQLATALAARDRRDAARTVVLPVAVGAYDSPERPAAQALLARLPGPAAAKSQEALP
ncbi:hypothetical protein [Sphingomonas sp. CROZ-RG-20F-R02-07]|uniref:hypothetical protein n=1 Tax=Sphingomonas sp. CROZ-RG-20F-R02-07 TaxID=2914832 RepID=UPI001F586B2A|nr:hypothetical protein [Sphingomonas sp. CROZ-RG-20F-R02-07]